MRSENEYRVGIGSPDGRRSAIWKFAVSRSEIYVVSHMFGRDTKVSLHSSGDSQFSGTSEWVLKVPGRKNAERHFHKWHEERPVGTEAKHVLRVIVPESELRDLDVDEDVSRVHWLPAPTAGSAMVLECYITPPSATDPSSNVNNALPCPFLFSLMLRDERWLVVLYHARNSAGLDVDVIRDAVLRAARERAIDVLPTHRACALLTDGSLRSLMELCPN